MDATQEQIEGLIINYRRALRKYSLKQKEKKQCLKRIKELEQMKESLLKKNK